MSGLSRVTFPKGSTTGTATRGNKGFDEVLAEFMSALAELPDSPTQSGKVDIYTILLDAIAVWAAYKVFTMTGMLKPLVDAITKLLTDLGVKNIPPIII